MTRRDNAHMNTRDLEYFNKLVELKNFSHVAKFFAVTQPTITFSLKRLEDYFSIQLINRDQSHGQLSVTEAGNQLFERSKIITGQLELARTELARVRQHKLKLGMPPIIGSYYFPKIASELVKQNLMDVVDTKEGGSDDLFYQMRSGDLDIALLGSTGPKIAEDMDITQIMSVPFTIVVDKQHPLAQLPEVAFADLKKYSFVSLAEGFVIVQAFDWFVKNAQMQPEVLYRTSDVAMLKKMIKERVGIGFLTEIAVTPEDDLVTIPLTDKNQPEFIISVFNRKNQVLENDLLKLKNVLVQTK